MTTYNAFAPFYDGPDQLRFVALFDQYLRELLERYPAPGTRLLDLACGTGTLALYFADRGWDVVGVDASEAMLTLGRAKAANLETSGTITLIQADMRCLPVADAGDQQPATSLQPGFFALATCIYDSLNYLLTSDDLAACFRGVARALQPGGLFIVDMNTRHFLEHDWPECDASEQPGFIQLMRSEFNPSDECSTMTLTCFVEENPDTYWRFDETHVERAYAPQMITDLLAHAGLQVEATYDCFTFDPPYPRSQRLAWVARKRV